MVLCHSVSLADQTGDAGRVLAGHGPGQAPHGPHRTGADGLQPAPDGALAHHHVVVHVPEDEGTAMVKKFELPRYAERIL